MTTKLDTLRGLMKARGVNCYVVPTEDAHHSEYVADCDMRRAFVSDFTGSAGTAVVTASEAALWTDGRYFLQASQELSKDWTLMKSGMEGTPSIASWLSARGTVGFDPQVISFPFYDSLDSAGVKLQPVQENLVDQVWKDQPARPKNAVFVQTEEFAGQSSTEKVASLRTKMKQQEADHLVVSALDDVAWLMNLRGSDIDFNPVFFAYVVVSMDTVHFFIDAAKLDASITASLSSWTTLHDYASVFSFLSSISGSVWMDPAQCNMAIYNAIPAAQRTTVTSPVPLAKAIKNAAEVEGMRQCHIRDGAAKVQFIAWLQEQLRSSKPVDEVDAADQLESYRRAQQHFMGLSFPTISGSGPNGAIIHYGPVKGSCRSLSLDEVYLVDSGAQYKDGTTDVTRTMHFGTPTALQRECFTRVLQGHIALARAVFPKGTSGPLLDVLARQAVWEAGLNYNHGTGHGVGSFLNVHEGPQGIGSTMRRPEMLQIGLEPGMIVTDEPGYYHEGEFGIRIESVLAVVAASTPHQFGGPYYTFENLTMVPIDANLMDMTLLSKRDIEWINAYHAVCLSKLTPLLQSDSRALSWLRAACAPLTAH